jgi:hypothetical protein
LAESETVNFDAIDAISTSSIPHILIATELNRPFVDIAGNGPVIIQPIAAIKVASFAMRAMKRPSEVLPL